MSVLVESFNCQNLNGSSWTISFHKSHGYGAHSNVFQKHIVTGFCRDVFDNTMHAHLRKYPMCMLTIISQI